MDKESEQSQQQPDAEKEHAEGHDVYVTKDESGITSLSEEPAGADPSVTTDDTDGSDPDDDSGADRAGGDASDGQGS